MRAFYWSVRARGRRGRYGAAWTHGAAEAAVAAALLLMGLGISRIAGAPLPVIGALRRIPGGGPAGSSSAAGATPASSTSAARTSSPSGSSASSSTSTSSTSAAGAPSEVRAEILAGGSGRAVLVLSGTQAVLVDGGPPDVGLAVVSRLRALGIARVSAALLTNPRAGEALGLMAVLDAMPVERILDLAPGSSCAAHTAVLDDARAHGTPVQTVQRGASVSVGPAQLQVLWPAADLAGPGSLPASPGLVRLVDGSVHVLFAGGIDPGQLQAIQRLGPQLGSQVLEVPDQGGTVWTSDLLRLVNPRVAILEPPAAGSTDTTTLQRLAAAHVVTIEATRASDLQLQTDGHGLVLSFDPGLPGGQGSAAPAAPAPAAGATDACS